MVNTPEDLEEKFRGKTGRKRRNENINGFLLDGYNLASNYVQYKSFAPKCRFFFDSYRHKYVEGFILVQQEGKLSLLLAPSRKCITFSFLRYAQGFNRKSGTFSIEIRDISL